MNAINQAIPATFSPDTVFAIPMQSASAGNEREMEPLIPHRFCPFPEDALARRGIPDSALHD